MKFSNFSASSSYFLCISSLCVSVVTGYYIGYKRALSSDNTKSSPFLSSSFSLYPLWAKKKRKQSENDGKERATEISSKTVKDEKKTDKDIGQNRKESNFVQRGLVDLILPYPHFPFRPGENIVMEGDTTTSPSIVENEKSRQNAPEQYKRQLLVNDALLDQAMKETSEELYVLVHDPPSLIFHDDMNWQRDSIEELTKETYLQMKKDEKQLKIMRQLYLSELYPQLWDVACSLGKHSLKVVVLYANEFYDTPFSSSSHNIAESKSYLHFIKEKKEALVERRNNMIKDKKIQATFGLPMSYILNNKEEIGIFQEEKTYIPSKTPNKKLIAAILQYDFHLIEDISTLCSFYFPNSNLLQNSVNINTAQEITDTRNTHKYNIVCVGGTFDRLHNGHKKLLQLATSFVNIANPEAVLIVGVTNDEMLSKKKNKNLIANMEKRCQNVHKFLDMIRFPSGFRRVEIINDPYGPPIHEKECEAIIVSSETFLGGVKINEIRQGKGMKNLDLLITRRTQATLLSSTFIRDKDS